MRKRTFSLLTLRKIQNNILISELWNFSLTSRSYPKKESKTRKNKKKSFTNFEKRDFFTAYFDELRL
jgi:hypothetical protein